MRCGACSSNASTIAAFATLTTWNSVLSRSGVASTRISLTEQFDSGVFDYARVRANGGHFEHKHVTDIFVYELLMRLFHIGNFCFWVPLLNQLLLRNCEVNFVEICNVYVGKMIIKAIKRIFNSDKICRSYSDLNFGVTFLEQCISNCLDKEIVFTASRRHRTICEATSLIPFMPVASRSSALCQCSLLFEYVQSILHALRSTHPVNMRTRVECPRMQYAGATASLLIAQQLV